MGNLASQLAAADRLLREGKIAAALTEYDRLISAQPFRAEAHFNRAVALSRLGRTDEAHTGFRMALSLRPGWPAAMLALGHLEFNRLHYGDAEAWFQRAADASPASAEAQCNLGLAQLRQLHPARALPALRRARELAPDSEAPWLALRRALTMLRQEQEARDDFLQFAKGAAASAQVIAAGLETARVVPGDELERRYLPLAFECRYGPADLDALSRIVGGLPYFDVPAEASSALYRSYDRLAQASRANVSDLAQEPLQDGSNRLRIGLLSADFRNHVMGRIIEDVIARHDTARFEIRLYSLAPPGGEDDLTERVRQRTAGFTRLAGLSDHAAARAIADDRLHILVDLMTHTSWSQPGILLLKPAPVIVTHLGSHGAVGLRQVDFKITDAVADLDDAAMFQIERPLPMDGSIIPIRRTGRVLDERPARAIRTPLVFGSFVSLQKTSPRCISAWKRILDRVPGAMLVFSPYHDAQRELYRNRLESFGIGARRVGFLPRTLDDAMDRDRYAEIDVMLDAFPYTGGDSAACAMAEGIPFVTLCGTRHPERVATSVLTHLGIIETIARSDDEYVDLAVRLAQDRSWRDAIAERIRTALPSHDAAMTAYTRSFEAALNKAWQQRDATVAPA